jgi:hypothetical protein
MTVLTIASARRSASIGAQIAQCRVTAAKVIDGDTNSELAQHVQHTTRA